MNVRERPRERLDRLGVSGLNDQELLALVLGHGTATRSATAIADAVLDAAGGVHGLTRVSRSRLSAVPGVGGVRAAQVLAAVELGRRTLVRQAAERQRLLASADFVQLLAPEFSARPVEQFGVVLLDGRYRLVRVLTLSVGSLTATVAHPREVFREAITAGAHAVAVFHNHPSGNPQPSAEDAVLTRRLVLAGEILGIEVVDHLILADARYYSFRDAGELG